MRVSSLVVPVLAVVLSTGGAVAACAASSEPSPGTPSAGDAGGLDAAADAEPGFDVLEDAAPADAPKPVIVDPKTCEEAASSKSYVGCDFWPTPVANTVWSIFDFAAIVANAGTEEARVTVTGPGGFKKEAIVGAGRLVKVYLPWVPALKGEEADSCGRGKPYSATVRADKSAYHLVTTRPVTVYQFSALEYEGKGGPPGKSWTACPGNEDCIDPDLGFGFPIGCYSFTNDASLLLPSTALTGNYRVTGAKGSAGLPSYVALTGTRNDTTVTVKLGPKGRVAPGGGIPSILAGGSATFKLGEGDVVQLLATGAAVDISGALITASKPIQVIAGVPCVTNPSEAPACDHVEESVFPAETFGKRYVVTGPTGPNGGKPGHVVRLYGNVDGTTLSYKPSAPTGAPTTLNAGDVIDLGVVKDDFEVEGSAEFAVGSFMLGGSLVDPAAPEGLQKGDPSMSMITSVEQHRTKYVFLAPDDYDVNYVDVVAAAGTTLTLDGVAVSSFPETLGDWEVHRIKLDPGPTGVGAHTLDASKPVGIQVLGYGLYTSYHYPGGLNLSTIAPPPVK